MDSLSRGGVLLRQKVGTKQDAIDLLRKRKNDIRVGIKCPRTCGRPSSASRFFAMTSLDVAWHEAVSPYSRTCFRRPFGEHVALVISVAMFNEDRLTSVPSPGGASLGKGIRILNWHRVPVFPAEIGRRCSPASRCLFHHAALPARGTPLAEHSLRGPAT